MLQDRLDTLSPALGPISRAEQACLDCNVEETDYTVYSLEDLAFEHAQLKSDVQSRKRFVENQVSQLRSAHHAPSTDASILIVRSSLVQ